MKPQYNDVWEKDGEVRIVESATTRHVVWSPRWRIGGGPRQVTIGQWNKWAKGAKRTHPQDMACPVCGNDRYIVHDQESYALACWHGCAKLETASKQTVTDHPELVIEAKSTREMLRELKAAMK